MNLIILTPTMPSRSKNWEILKRHYLRARSGVFDLFWMPVFFMDEINSLTAEQQQSLREIWIIPVVVSPKDGFLPVYRKQNIAVDFIATQFADIWIYPEADDNLFPVSFPRRIMEMPDDSTGVIVPSVARGQHKAASGYDPTPLLAAPQNMVRSQCTSAVFRLQFLGKRRWVNHPHADGMMIETLHRENPEQFRFMPDLFTAFNALEDGRWDEEPLKQLLET